MVITVLEAKVSRESWDLLRKTYKSQTADVPPEIKASYLLQDQKDSTVWKILTVWESQAALDAMRQSGATPVGVVIFNKVAATPQLSINSVEAASGF